jgi:hypothetical protein
LGNRVAFTVLDVRHIIIFLAEVDESRGIRNLLAGSSLLDKGKDILFNLAVLKGETNFFAGLESR